jgi:hypothetical protein
MAIQDDFTIDYVNRRITYTTAFVEDRPPSIYTVNELYSFLQDTFDEPAQMDDPIPMSAQTPTQYTLLYPWFIDNESMKALYGGSIQTSSWTKSSANGITALRYQNTPTDAPAPGDEGVTVTGGTSTATGVVVGVDTTRQIIWVRNTSVAQFQNNEAVTGTGINVQTMTEAGFQNGESIWSNLFSVGSKATTTEIYIGQEDDYLGGTAYHDVDADSKYERRIEKIDEWWDVDVDFATGSPNLLGGAGHFDVLVLTQELGSAIDGQRLAIFAREFGRVYTSFELVGGVGNFVVPFASTGADLNSADGPYEVNFDGRTGNDLEIGDVLENNTGPGTNDPVGRLRAVVTAVTGGAAASGSIEYYLIGENEPLTTTDRTLVQLADNDDLGVRGDTTDFDVMGSPTAVTGGPAQAQGITFTFADAQVDVDEDGTSEEYACTIDCNNIALATVYQRAQFLTCRGNQDGTVADTQDTLLPSGNVSLNEAGEFYRAVGDIIFNYDGGAGTQPTEGDLVTNGSGAYGVVVSITAGTTGVCVLTQVKGTFADNDDVYEIDAAGTPTTNKVVVMGTPTSITDNTGAPFGTFAGGRWFLAQGVVLTNVPAADANNWETSDLTGTRRVPPAVRVITFAGLVVNDRAAIFEVDTAGGDDITKNQNGVSGTAAVGATTFTLDTTVALDVPTSGWVRVVDTSDAVNGTEFRFEYSSVSGTTVTFRTGAGLSGTATSLGSSTVLNDTGAFTNFGTDGFVKTGHEIRNTTDLSRAVVLRKIDNDSIETTPLTGGTDDTWEASDNWAANVVVVALDGTDTVYFPFIDDVVVAGTSLTATIKYVADTDCIARARFSDPDVGGQRILPFELRNVTITDADLTVTAIRTNDDIASP